MSTVLQYAREALYMWITVYSREPSKMLGGTLHPGWSDAVTSHSSILNTFCAVTQLGMHEMIYKPTRYLHI
jgi:hypothetical protein